ncbi:hypothetical protein F3K44_06085 [Bacillus megaterium]|nr:hypothetical protein [Priestia megaterium]
MKKKVLLLFSDYHFPTDNGKRIMLKGFYEFFEKEEVDYFIIGSEKEITSNEIKVTNLPKANFLEKIYNLFVYSLILRKKSFQEAIMFNKRAKDILDNIDYSKYDVVLIDTVRISQYISDKNIVSNMYLYLDDLYSRRYEKMIEVKGEYKDIDINPLGNFKSKLPKLAQKFLKNKIIEKIVLKFEKALIYNSEIRESKRFHNVLLINFDEANHLSKLVDKPIQDIKPRIIHQEKGLKRKLDSNSSFSFFRFIKYCS